MRSVTRKAAITAGLGAALAAGAAGSASAAPPVGLVDELSPSASTAQPAMPDAAAAPFPVSQVTDVLPAGKVLTPGQSPLDSLAANVAENTAHNMEQGMGDMAAEQSGPAKGGLGSPLSALPTEKLSTGASPLGGSPLEGLPL
ncbi:hypothetical protein [Embleya sp. NPDC005575]|uniref:hypothetical protein n=1 Tax=Embleya sp. NPDC005575 TaxID=3156892 RepID=UPI0033A3D695